MADSLADFFSNSAQANLSKSGGYGGGVSNFLGALLPGIAALRPDKPFWQAANAIGQAVNAQNYNKYLQKVASESQAYERGQANSKQADRAMLGKQFGLTGYSGAADLPDAATLNRLGEVLQNPNNQKFLETGQFSVNPYGKVDPETFRKVMDRAATVNDADRTLSLLPQWMFESETYRKPGESPDLDYSFRIPKQVQQLQAAASKGQMVTPGEAYNYAAPDVGHILTGRQNEQKNTLGQAELKEHVRAAKEEEDLKRKVYQATIKNQGGYGRSMGGGGNQNPYTIPNAQEEYINKQVAKIDKQLQAMGQDPNKEIKVGATETSDGFFGLGGTDSKTAAKNRAIKSLLDKRNALLGGGTFGGGQTQTLTQNATNMGSGIPSVKQYFKK